MGNPIQITMATARTIQTEMAMIRPIRANRIRTQMAMINVIRTDTLMAKTTQTHMVDMTSMDVLIYPCPRNRR